MTAPIDLCNLALSHIGERGDIASIDPPEASVEAQRCAQFYPMTRKLLLAMHPWSFATKRVTAADLSASNTVPETWTYAYGLPAGVIKILGVYDGGEWRDETYADQIAYEIGSDSTGPMVLYSNAEDAVIRYIFDQTDSTLYPPLFVEAFSWLLAGRLAGPTIKGTEGVRVGQAATQQGMAWAMKAASEDANQSASRRIQQDDRHMAPWMGQRSSSLWGRTDR
jgi:hypothetical protein